MSTRLELEFEADILSHECQVRKVQPACSGNNQTKANKSSGETNPLRLYKTQTSKKLAKQMKETSEFSKLVPEFKKFFERLMKEDYVAGVKYFSDTKKKEYGIKYLENFLSLK